MKRSIARPARSAAAVVAAVLVVWLAAALRADEPTKPPLKQSPASESPATESVRPEANKSEPAAPAEAAEKQSPGAEWPVGLERARKRAQADGKPLLVRAGAPWCPWCDKLLDQFDAPEVQEQLKRWTLVYVDIDDTPGEARQLSVGAIPALRVVNAAGKVVATQEGYLDQDELLAWLKESFDRAALERPEVLLTERDLQPDDVDKLIRLLQSSDPLAREAALRRLMPNQKLAAAAVVEAFADGKLATRLLTLELLSHWQAPVAALDPWRPETVTPERIKALQAWVGQETVERAAPAKELSAEDLQAANDAIARLVEDDDAQAAARVEQLARFGAALRPLLIEKLKEAVDDRARERLLLLRYRLAASDALVLTWTGGLARLASSDVNVRHQATSQLVERATAADEPLLLELFADADPLVREISLRGLRSVGTDASSSALVKLLDDPEPNVRAAVLKQLAESPDAALSSKISAYLKTETDADLVVHGVRVLKAAAAPANLIELLHHPSWQVRAEAAEALGTLASPHNPNEAAADIYTALIEVLSDEDPFVISRAVHALRSAELPSAVEPLAKAAAEHPEIAAEVIGALTEEKLRATAEPVLRRYIDHKDPQLRAQVITALANATADDVGDLIERGLKDPASEVRTATAKKFLEICNQLGLKQAEGQDPFTQTVFDVQGGASFSVVTDLSFDNFKAAPAKPPEQAEDKTEEPAKTGKEDEPAEPAKDDEPVEPAKEDSAPDEDDEGERSKEAGELVDDPELVAFREGKARPDWMNRAITPLESMLKAEAPEEREAAALAILPLGHDEPALEVLRKLIALQPGLLVDASHALPWLPWPERLKFFEELLAKKPDGIQLNSLAQQMLAREPERGVSRLWTMLEADDQTIETAFAVGRPIIDNQVVYGGAKLGKKQKAELTRYATEGTAWQKNVAIARLIEVSADNATELAQRIYEDPKVAEAFRHDAFQLLLLASDDKDGSKIAAREIPSADPAIRKLALLYLAGGPKGVGSLRNEASLNPRGGFFNYPREAVSIEPPAGVTLEMLKPLLADPDDETAAAAGCLAALLGSSDGLSTLVRVWRAHKDSDSWTPALYRAIAALDDDQNTPVLAEINRQLSTWDKARFYWTIRSMHGPAVLKLRKQIRDDVGMDALGSRGSERKHLFITSSTKSSTRARIMNLRRILWAATTVVLCLSADVFVHAQPMGRESTVSGTGMEIIKRTPETLRMQIEISAKAKTLGVALKKLEAHRDAALNQLAKMSSEKETTRAGEVRISAPNPQQHQMEMMVRQRMRQAGKKNKKAPEKPVAVTCTLTAEWNLKGKTPVELLLEAQAIEDKVRGADLAGGDTEEKTAEEQELAEEMAEQMPNFDDDSQPKPGEPTFLFVSKISSADRTKATTAAFAKARQQAEELSIAAGAELGGLLGLSRQVTPNNLAFGMSPYYGNMRNQRLMQVMLGQAEGGDDDGAEAIGAQPSEVALPINVTAAFQLKGAK